MYSGVAPTQGRGPDLRRSSRSVGTQLGLMMAYVYILESLRDGRYYIGSTIDLGKRLRHHIKGFTPSTKKFGKIRLVFRQKYSTLKEARFIERKLKRMKRKDYLRKIIKEGFIKIKPNDPG